MRVYKVDSYKAEKDIEADVVVRGQGGRELLWYSD